MKNSKLKNYAKTIISIQNMMARTPAYVIEKIKPEEVQQLLSSAYETYSKLFNSYNWAAQLKAKRIHDITKNFNGSINEAANTIKTKFFIIVSLTDLIVNPKPALEFANLINSETYIFENNCGYLAPGCEMEKFKEMVYNFFGD